MASEVSSKPEGIQRALLIGVEKVTGFPNLPQAHKDVEKVKDFLVKCMYICPMTENIVELIYCCRSWLPSRKHRHYDAS